MQKPQILLIGDSIRMGYCETVKADLATDIDVLYPDENCQSSYYILQNLKGWVDITRPENVIAVHFNCGHWDAAHFGGDPDSLSSPDVYAQNILRIARRLRQYFPKAAIAYATTTPMHPDGIPPINARTTEEIRTLNQAGRQALAPEPVAVNDLFAYTEHWGSETFQDGCHFTEEASQVLGHRVSAFLRELVQL